LSRARSAASTAILLWLAAAADAFLAAEAAIVAVMSQHGPDERLL